MPAAQQPDWWHEVSTHLEKALGMTGEERAAWLASLRQQDALLASRLETLLDEQRLLAEEQFLEQPLLQPALPGRQAGAYTLLSPIGQGGMGTVWLAERTDGRFERKAAIKFLTIQVGARAEERFRREGSFVGRLSHPHIAELLDAGVSAEGRLYLVLEYVEGEPVDRFCDRSKLDVPARIRLFLDVLAAVAHAHANLIVHRDLKPSNVLVRTDGQVKLLDFGIAKLVEEEGRSTPATQLTGEDGSPLTPAFAAPEQVTGGPVTTATDIYALGVLLYLLLTGRHPAGPGPYSPADLVKSIIEIDPPLLSSVAEARHAADCGTTPGGLRRVLRGDLETIVAKALKKDPRERYLSVTGLADDLGRYLAHQPISARADSLFYRAARFSRRHRAAVVLTALAVAASVAGLLGTLMQARRARAERDFALLQLSRAEAINDLNSFLLSDAAPSGKPFTVNELLGRAEHIVNRQLGGGSADRVELLLSIGTQYLSQDEDAKARRVLDQAYSLSRGLSEPSTRARTSCALAAVLVYDGALERAEALIQEGLHSLPRDPRFDFDRISCLLRGAEVATQTGSAREPIARIEAAQRLLKQSPLRSELLELRAAMKLAETYRVVGRLNDAADAFEQASLRLTALGRDDTQTAGTLYNNWALAVSQVGRLPQAEQLFRRAIDISSSGQGEQSVSPMLLNNYARVLHDIGRVDQAADYVKRAHDIASQAGDPDVISQSIMLQAVMRREAGDLAGAGQLLSEVEGRWRTRYPPGHTAFASIVSQRSLIAQAQGDLYTAMDLANQAAAIVEASVKAGRQGPDVLPNLLMRRAAIELALHRPDDAVADARRSLSIRQQLTQPGTFSSTLGAAWLALGHALQGQGNHDEARAAFRVAAEHLQNTLVPDHPDTQTARQLGALHHP